ncbi:MAG: transglutaminase domain-containing protein [Planctomycetes bacterium]|nr:transglutaminase domain-containing protein [Planctomycetota bacterium]
MPSHPSRFRLCIFTVGALTTLLAAQEPKQEPVVALDLAALAHQHALLAARLDAAKPLELPNGGLCGVQGATTVRLGGKAAVTLQLPLPQLTQSQVPLVFGLVARPPEALQSLALHSDADGDRLVAVLQGKSGTEVTLAWNAIVLLAERPEPAPAAAAQPFLAATPCAQSGDAAIAALADALAPVDAPTPKLATALQDWLPGQPPKKRPRSMDALGLLASGNHGICTMNANLGVALLRQRGVPARSLAVVPTTGQKLEMHRIVEWHADGHWHRFDPSRVHAEVPMRSSQSVVMAHSSIADEERGGKLRMAVPVGCPFGQEIEIVRGQAMLFGTDFFWTQALPLAAFAAEEVDVKAAATAWQQFRREGRAAPAADRAAAAGDGPAFHAAWGN